MNASFVNGAAQPGPSQPSPQPQAAGGQRGRGPITPKMLEELAKAAARGKLAEQHMRAFAELCRSKPEAREMFQREQALIQMQTGQQQFAALAAANPGNRNGYNSPQPAAQQPPAAPQQQARLPNQPPQQQAAANGGITDRNIAQITPEQLLDLNVTITRQLGEAQAYQQRSQNTALPQAEREGLAAQSAQLKARIGPIAIFLNKSGLLSTVDSSTPESQAAALDTMRQLLSRRNAAMAAANAARTGSPAVPNTGGQQPPPPPAGAGFSAPGQASPAAGSPNPNPAAANRAGQQSRPVAAQAKTPVPSRPASAGPAAQMNGQSSVATVNLPPAMQNQYSAIAQQQQQASSSSSQHANQQAQVALSAATPNPSAQQPQQSQPPTPAPPTVAASRAPSATPAPTNASPTPPEQPTFPVPRASLTGGHAHGSSMSAGAVYKPPVNGVTEALGGGPTSAAGPVGGMGGGAAGGEAGAGGGAREGARGAVGGEREAGRVVSKRKIQELVESIDPSERLDPEVEDLCLEIADEFIDSVTRFGCQLAKHRKSDRLECKDIQLHLERAWNIRIPGFANDEIRQSQSRRVNASPAYQARVAAVREAMKRRGGGA